MKRFYYKPHGLNSSTRVSGSYSAVETDSLYDYEDEVDDGYWMLLDRKDVKDRDGFWTEYSLYCYMPFENKYVTVFGDSDLYSPEQGYFDAEFDNEQEAYEFFNDYEGFIDDGDF